MTAPPRSRLLVSIEAAIKKAANPIEAQCLRAERAALLARQGQLERAQGAIDELKAQLAWQPHNSLVRGWVALAEGLHAYYSVIGEGCGEAFDLAWRMAGDSGAPGQRLGATVAAWRAVLGYNDKEPPATIAGWVRQSLDLAAPEHRGARARATLAAGLVYHYAQRHDCAHGWYEASRRHAITEGDEAHLSALMYNQAMHRAHQAQIALAFGDADSAEAAAQALMSVESIGHYDAGIGTASLGSLVPLMRAEILTAQARFAEAWALYDAHFDSGMAEGFKRIEASFLADRAWCAYQLGHGAAARSLAAAAAAALAGPIDFDDRMIALARLAQLREAFGETAHAAALRDEARGLRQQHRALQNELADALDAALRGLDPKTV
jgi:hypothetical protein